MGNSGLLRAAAISGLLFAAGMIDGGNNAFAQTQQAAASPSDTSPAATAAPEPLSDDELQVLVAGLLFIRMNWWR